MLFFELLTAWILHQLSESLVYKVLHVPAFFWFLYHSSLLQRAAKLALFSIPALCQSQIAPVQLKRTLESVRSSSSRRLPASGPCSSWGIPAF